ncbi:flagellar hook-length control protein FliK [Halomonas sp. LR5S13]|uniref:flagellar hook-length control protein FliK n=1 Tax=Halomonas rhizosphaerae TaxID=3043296 RepID=UPI0024A9FB9D|nr:flagellar hook-length control protein FliK [Halomonas rhizosphaerae]MDI5922803.1 flagellar hook-length control protein FliK [Halomonas rhizosphaerae]
MDIQLLVAATNGRTTSGGTKDQGAGGDFASNLAGASRARQSTASEGSLPAEIPTQHVRSQKEALGASLNEMGHPAGRGLDVVDHDALLSSVSGKPENAPNALLTSLGREGAGHHQAFQVTMAPLSEGDVMAGFKALKGEGDADLPSGDVWDALQKRLDLIEQAGRLETGEDLAIVSLAAQAESTRPEGISVRDAGHEPRGNALLQAIAADTLERKGLRQSLATQLDRTVERTGGLEAASSRTTFQTDELPQQVSGAIDTLMASRSDTARATGGFELAGQGMTPSMASATTPNAQANIPTPVSSPAWPQQLGQQLVRLSQSGGEQRVELQLHPAELGPLSVSLKMGDQGAQAQFISAHAQVRQALEQAIPQLREALAEQGISLGETSVGEQRNGNGDSAPRQPGDMLASAGPDESDEGAPRDIESKVARELNMDGHVDLYA